jgi:hypothetical protein
MIRPAPAPLAPVLAALNSLIQFRYEIEHRRDDDVDRHKLEDFPAIERPMPRSSGVLKKRVASALLIVLERSLCLHP